MTLRGYALGGTDTAADAARAAGRVPRQSDPMRRVGGRRKTEKPCAALTVQGLLCLILFPVFDSVYSHVLSEHFRNDDASVCLLAVLQNSRNGSSDCEAGAV